MVHYMRKVQCPFCLEWAEIGYSTNQSAITSGSIIRTCPHCRRQFIDAQRQEEAISLYNGVSTSQGLFVGICLTIIFLGISFLMFSLSENGLDTVVVVTGAIGLFFLFLVVRNLIKNRKSERIKRLENGGDTPALCSSLLRLSDPEYLELMVACNHDVPEWFFERIGLNKAEIEKKYRTNQLNQDDDGFWL